ncbi:MAG: hypothetical protein Q9170_002247 [Blastenia crenularia]
MSRTNYFCAKPTQIRFAIGEHVPRNPSTENMTGAHIYGTQWTKPMLERLQQLNNSGLDDVSILRRLKEQFGLPEMIEEIWQERSFLVMGKYIMIITSHDFEYFQVVFSSMEFIEGIGERYLIGKANAVPQQLEALAKKQFKAESAIQNVEKDREIEKLRKELAEAKLSNGKHAKETTGRRQSVDIGGLSSKSIKSPERAQSISHKSMTVGSLSHGNVNAGRTTHDHQAKEVHKTPRRGRSNSVRTAFAARAHSLEHNKPSTHQGAHQTHNTRRGLSSKASPSGHVRPPPMTAEIPAESPPHQAEKVHETIQSPVSERSRPATDFCVVEVIHEEPRRQRSNRSRQNLVEVIQKDRNRTRYVIR